LVFGLAAGAPIIGFTGFDVDGKGSFACNVGSGHGRESFVGEQKN
jgi:hypothetical protein